MSVQKIIQESINMNPLEMKEAIAGELRARVALALEAKMKDDEEEDDEDEDDDMKEEVESLDELSPAVLGSYTTKAVMGDGGNTARDLKAKSRAHKTLGNDSEADKYKAKAKQRDTGVAKALARSAAQKGTFMGTPGSNTEKAAKKMPQTYYKTKTEE